MKWIDSDDLSPYRPIPLVEFQCFHCKRETRFVAKSMEELEARYWKDRHAKMAGIAERCEQENRYAVGRLRNVLANRFSQVSGLMELVEQAKALIETLDYRLRQTETKNAELLSIMGKKP